MKLKDDINKNLQILNDNDNILNKELEEKCEIYLNQKKQKIIDEYKFKEKVDVLFLYH